jgi:hypothetical protein
MAADNAESIARVFASKFFSEIALHVVPEARPDRL